MKQVIIQNCNHKNCPSKIQKNNNLFANFKSFTVSEIHNRCQRHSLGNLRSCNDSCDHHINLKHITFLIEWHGHPLPDFVMCPLRSENSFFPSSIFNTLK